MARPTPVAICTTKMPSVALAKTYHHPMRPRARRARGGAAPRAPSRQAPDAHRATPAPRATRRASRGLRRLDRRQRLGADHEPPALDLPIALEERPLRRAAGHAAVGVEDAAVARAEEDARGRPD